LRAEAPIARMEPDGYRPFWAVTRHADVIWISTRPELFVSARGIILARHDDTRTNRSTPSEMVISIDPPRHGALRRLASLRFTPRALRRRRADIERIAGEILDAAATGDVSAEGDFVERISAPLPIAVIAWILGVPREDWHLLFRWTNEVIGADDPEY